MFLINYLSILIILTVLTFELCFSIIISTIEYKGNYSAIVQICTMFNNLYNWGRGNRESTKSEQFIEKNKTIDKDHICGNAG